MVQTDCKNHHVIVADNASTDASIPFLEEQYPNIRLLQMSKNTGFAQGYNIALQEVETDYIVLLNSDVEVTPNWLQPIITYLETHPKVAAVQPKILSHAAQNTFEHAGASGGYIDNWGYPFCRGRIMDFCEQDTGQYDTIQEIFWASGAALVVRKDLYQQFGGLDAAFFAHMEEIDFCWRLKRAGYQIMVLPESVVYHVGGGTLNYVSPQKTYLNFRNSLSMLFKNEAASKLFWLLPLRLVLDGVAGFRFLLQGKFAFVWAIIRAHWAFFFSIGKWIKKRRFYNQIIEQNRVDAPNHVGQYKGSIIWQYFIKGRKKFSAIIEE